MDTLTKTFVAIEKDMASASYVHTDLPCEVCGALPVEQEHEIKTYWAGKDEPEITTIKAKGLPCTCGMEMFDKDENGNLILSKEYARKVLLNERMQYANVSRIYQSLEGYQVTEKNKEAHELITKCDVRKLLQEGKGIFLIGTTGTGKTWLLEYLVWIAATMFLIKAKVVKWSDFIAEIKGYSDWDNSLESIIEEYKKVPLLMVDDIGNPIIPERRYEHVFSLFDYRYEHKKATLATSNLNADTLKINIGDPILSRISGMCKDAKIAITGIDYRTGLNKE
jgi:DNA replication protein DnaC